MKKLTSICFLMLCITLVYSQVPEAFNYQAVVRDASGNVITNQPVTFKVSILTGSVSSPGIYSETHSVSTNDFGLANLKIGRGDNKTGIFSPGGWGLDSHFLKLEIDINGGSAFVDMGTTELLSVPYAFHAQTVEVDNVDDADADPGNEIQTLSLSNSDLSLSKGWGSVTLPAGDDWDSQSVVSDATLDGNGTTGSPLKIANQSASAGQVLKWSGTTWSPDDDLLGGNYWTQSGSTIYISIQGKLALE